MAYIYDAKKRKEYGRTPAGRKSNVIGLWKFRGIQGDLDFLYDNYYVDETNCWWCKKAFSGTKDRCIDPDHETGEFRQVLCQRCNSFDRWLTD